jgi:hypothetical protein
VLRTSKSKKGLRLSQPPSRDLMVVLTDRSARGFLLPKLGTSLSLCASLHAAPRALFIDVYARTSSLSMQQTKGYARRSDDDGRQLLTYPSTLRLLISSSFSCLNATSARPSPYNCHHAYPMSLAHTICKWCKVCLRIPTGRNGY